MAYSNEGQKYINVRCYTYQLESALVRYTWQLSESYCISFSGHRQSEDKKYIWWLVEVPYLVFAKETICDVHGRTVRDKNIVKIHINLLATTEFLYLGGRRGGGFYKVLLKVRSLKKALQSDSKYVKLL